MTNFDSTPYLLCLDCGEYVIESEADGHDCPEPDPYLDFWNYYPHSHVQILMLEAKSADERQIRLCLLSEGSLKSHLLDRQPLGSIPGGCRLEKEAYAAYQQSLRAKPAQRGRGVRSTKEKE